MLEDRSYMRRSPFQPQKSATVILIFANLIAFVLQYVFERSARPPAQIWFQEHFYLSLAGLKHFYLWQFVTFQFLHGGPLHILFNLITLYFFGAAVEEALGHKDFLKLYFLSGIGGGALQMLFALLFPSFNHAVIGASAGVFGLVAAFAAMFPDRVITLLLFFIIPVSMRARTLLWGSIVIAIVGMLAAEPQIAHAAHLGGILAGWAYIAWYVHGPFRFHWRRNKSTRPRRELVGATAPRRGFWTRNKAAESEEILSGDFITREVDPILDKISAHGIQSLTERERKILEAARARMAKR